MKINGVCWVLTFAGRVLLERCPKKAAKLGVGEWFIPGGKVEGDETPEQCLARELQEEWPGVRLLAAERLPIIEGSPVNVNHAGIFLMRPYLIAVVLNNVPKKTSEGIELRWFPIADALRSPVSQVRMMVACAHAERWSP
jgi:8-oxo-dGTP diphosphatase